MPRHLSLAPSSLPKRPAIVGFRSFEYDEEQFRTLTGREQKKYAAPSQSQLESLQGEAHRSCVAQQKHATLRAHA